MTRSGASVGTSLALVVGVAALAAAAAIVLVPRSDSGSHVAQRAGAGDNTVHIVLPPPKVAAAPPVAATAVSIATAEPFEPPAPPMGVAAPSPPASPSSSVVAAAPSSHRPGDQVAALTPPEASAELSPLNVPAPLRAIERERRAVHIPLPHGEAAHRAAAVDRERDITPPGERPSLKRAAVLPERRDTAGDDSGGTSDGPGVKIDGPAIVTGTLELNVAGKPLRLYGVKAPSSADVCAPNAEYAARSCPDVSREALAARIGQGGKVSCRILASGGRQALPAVCKDGSGTDLASYLVAHGFAFAEANDMMIDYSAAETQAKSAHTGLWSDR